jgi:hypothetical protein
MGRGEQADVIIMVQLVHRQARYRSHFPDDQILHDALLQPHDA